MRNQRPRLEKLELLIDSAVCAAIVIEFEVVDCPDGRPVPSGERLRWNNTTGRYEPVPSGDLGPQDLGL
jgi:hypothetical protein